MKSPLPEPGNGLSHGIERKLFFLVLFRLGLLRLFTLLLLTFLKFAPLFFLSFIKPFALCFLLLIQGFLFGLGALFELVGLHGVAFFHGELSIAVFVIGLEHGLLFFLCGSFAFGLILFLASFAFLAGFFLGFGFLFYIILWIVIPEARTAAEKLQMKGEPVNIENLGKSFEAGAEKVNEKIKNMDASRFGKSIESFLKSVFHVIGTLLKGIIKAFGKIFGFLFLAFGAFLSVIFISSLFSG